MIGSGTRNVHGTNAYKQRKHSYAHIKINLLQIHNKYSKKAIKSQDHRLKENRRVLSNVFVTLPVLLL